MTTWTCKLPLAFAAFFALSACEDGQGLDLFAVPDDTKAAAKPVALSESKMSNGAFTLVPPEGYCIDKATLKQRFALLARCETLGAPTAAGGSPVGIITVSVVPNRFKAELPTPQETADANKLARITSVKSENDAVTFRAEGAPPNAGLDVVHWRGSALLGGQQVGLALYGPKGGRAVTGEGREVLNAMIRKSREKSRAE